MSGFQSLNPKIASFALQKLRDASEKIPENDEKERIRYLLKDVKNANEKIAKCEKSYREKAELLNKTIAHSISNLVDKGIVDIEQSLKAFSEIGQKDLESLNSRFDDLLGMKERLVYFFDLVSGWGWSHLRRVQQERIAEVYEKIDQTAADARKMLKEKAAGLPGDQKDRLMDLYEKFNEIITCGSDRINPDEIFASD